MNENSLLGSLTLTPEPFPTLAAAVTQFDTPAFKQLPAPKRFDLVNATLLDLIKAAPREAFLLSAVIDYISHINAKKILNETYHFTQFEFWLNHYSTLSSEENALIRGKIAGKYLPRESYQAFFPLGMDKTFSGSHFVVAHLSPDIDTTVASFWGWLDAFAARVSEGTHFWSLPGGPPESPIIQIFRDIFGVSIFSYISRSASTLTLTAMDMVTKKNFVKETPTISISSLDHGFNEKAVILVNELGHYLGDWRNTDVEPIRQIIILFKACLRWFENNLHYRLIEMFAKKDLCVDDISVLLDKVFEVPLQDSETVQEFSDQQRSDFEALLIKVLGLPKGLKSSFSDLNGAFEKLSLHDLTTFRQEIEALRSSDLFDASGQIIEDRPRLFKQMQHILASLNTAIHSIRDGIEGLGVSMQIKSEVLGKSLHYLTMRSDVEDIRIKMSNYNYLTVVVPAENGALFPVGVVWANDLRKPILGTVSYRDFSNPDEVKMASYLSVISVVDHHKTNLKTNSPALALIGDAQSCNVLVAEQTMALNDVYSVAGIDEPTLTKQQASLQQHDSTSGLRLFQRLLERRMAFQTRGPYYVHPMREWTEYLLFIHAILDDTDLLTKVSNRDVTCVAELLNRMKTLMAKQEMEIVSLDDIPKDKDFAKKAAQRLLQLPDLYSLYRQIYQSREQEVADNLQASADGQSSHFFEDTKEQNGCCRIGQAKMFSSNFPLYHKYRDRLQQQWIKRSQEVYQAHPEMDFHLFMISTIASPEEVYEGKISTYDHLDELWIWIPDTEQAQDHLGSFLNAFQTAGEITNNKLELSLPQSKGERLEEAFKRNFLHITTKKEEKQTLATLKYIAGTLNSRKAMISPYLPRLVT